MSIHPSIDEGGPARLLTYGEVAKALGISERSLWTLVQEGRIAAVRFGRTVRFDPADLRSFIERSKQRGPEGPGEGRMP